MTNQKCAVFGRHIKTFLLISQKCRRNWWEMSFYSFARYPEEIRAS
jgi:hypothetical protein